MTDTTAKPDLPPLRYAMAPYQYGTHITRRPRLRHPAQPLIWAAVLTFVPLFWLVMIAWFARVVF